MGGAGLIVTGGSAVNRVGAGGRNYSFINDDADAARLARVAAAVHEAGGLVLLQLFHAGRYAYEASFGLTPVAPSAVYSRYSRCEPRELSRRRSWRRSPISRGARGGRRAGVRRRRDHGLRGLPAQSVPGAGDEPARRRVGRRLGGGGCGSPLRSRARSGRRGAPAARLCSGCPGVVSSTAARRGRGREVARALAADGPVDAINVGIGWHEARVPTVQALVPHGAWRPWARAVREAVDVPVIASNRINTVALAEEALAAGDADFVSMARPFLADPEIIAKARDRRRLNICIACNQACIDRSIFDKRVSCLVNPRAGYELELGRAGIANGARSQSWAVARRAWKRRGRSRLPAIGRAVRGVRPARRPVPDGVPDPGQGGFRADNRLLRVRA